MSAWHSVGAPIMAGAFKLVELLFAAQFHNVVGPTSPFLKSSVVTDFYGFAQVCFAEAKALRAFAIEHLRVLQPTRNVCTPTGVATNPKCLWPWTQPALFHPPYDA